MTTLQFILPDGSRRQVDAREGQSLMECAIDNGIDGIVAECNGSMACATCHVFLDDETAERLEGPSEPEDEMLDFAATERRRTSRLSCQIRIDAELEGATIAIPPTQI